VTHDVIEQVRGRRPGFGAVAIGADIEVLHADADFETLARHADLRTHPASPR
jgi:hypothetical protein